MWFDPASGRRVAVWVFAMILSCSRALFVQPVLRMDQPSWNASHVAAFEFFGGVPARLVCDNLKTGVTRPDLYDPQINLAYGELAAFYGTLIDPARASKAEGQTTRRAADALHSGLVLRRPRSSTSLDADAGARRCAGAAEVYGVHKHRGLDGADPGDRCSPRRARCTDAVAAQSRLSRSSTPSGRVAPDCHVKSGKALYSVPWRLIGQTGHRPHRR